jgi:hypothetical protein
MNLYTQLPSWTVSGLYHATPKPSPFTWMLRSLLSQPAVKSHKVMRYNFNLHFMLAAKSVHDAIGTWMICCASGLTQEAVLRLY